MTPNLLFVYGTLKRGERLEHYLAQAHYVCPAVTVRRYAMYLVAPNGRGGYPKVVDRPVDMRGRPIPHGLLGCIRGELYRGLSRITWDALDLLEHHPIHYERRLAPVLTKSGQTCEAWIYFSTNRHVETATLITTF